MVVAREEFAALIARAFDGAVMVDGLRVIAHKSGMHVVRSSAPERMATVLPPLDRDTIRENDWSDL